jgi:hypothetical protein
MVPRHARNCPNKQQTTNHKQQTTNNHPNLHPVECWAHVGGHANKVQQPPSRDPNSSTFFVSGPAFRWPPVPAANEKRALKVVSNQLGMLAVRFGEPQQHVLGLGYLVVCLCGWYKHTKCNTAEAAGTRNRNTDCQRQAKDLRLCAACMQTGR